MTELRTPFICAGAALMLVACVPSRISGDASWTVSKSPVSAPTLPQSYSARPPAFPTLIPVEPHRPERSLGLPGSWSYFYDRNALVASQVVGPYLVAATEAGHVLVFDAASVALVSEALAPRKATCLGPATAQGPLIGFADGLIGRLAVPALTVTEMIHVPGRPLWLGERPGSDQSFVVYADTSAGDASSSPFERGHYTVRMLPSARETRIWDASAFFLDHQDRLWLGVDHGEFGGGLEVLDLKTGQLEQVSLPWPHKYAEGVYGLAQVHDEVWAYGGTMHFGCSAFVARVSPGPPKILYYAEQRLVFRPQKRVRVDAGPDCPVSHVVETSGKLVVISFNDVFETGPTLRGWKRSVNLGLRHLSGRPDAIGVYPAARAVHVLDDRVLIPTVRDGYVEMREGKVTRHALSGELPIAPTVIVSSATELAVAGLHEGIGFRVEGEWAPAESRWLPRAIDAPGAPVDATWCESAFFSMPHGKFRVIGKWGVKNGLGCVDREGIVVTGVVEDGVFQELSRTQSKLDIAVPDGGRTFLMLDAGTVLAATDRGLCTYSQQSPLCTSLTPLGLDEVVQHLVRDRAGRIWLAGRGLFWLAAPDRAVALRPFLPFLDDTDISDMSESAGRLALALGTRGLVVLDPAALAKAFGASTESRVGLPR